MNESPGKEDHQSELTRCPMCGGKNRPTAYRCTDCGEELRDRGKPIPPMLNHLPDDAVTLATQIRALSAMYAAIGCGLLLVAYFFWIERLDEGTAGERVLVSLLSLAGLGMFPLAVGVAMSSLAAIRVGMLICGVVAVGFTITCYLSPIGLLMVPGILQSQRILQLHEKIAHAAEEGWDAGVAENRSDSA